MSKATASRAFWEEVFANLTEDISMYCWVTENWDDVPDGYDQGTLLWDALNNRSRGFSGLALIKKAPSEYRDCIQKLNELWEIAEKELNGIIQSDYETINRIINNDFSEYQSKVEEKIKSARKIAQDGDLLDDPDWVEDDLREVGDDFLIEFQQMANLHEQLESKVFPNHVDVSSVLEKYKQIEKLFKKSFGYFNLLSESLSAIQKREYGKENWWLNKYPEADDIQEVEVPEDFLEDLMSSFRNEADTNVTDCSESENAILYAFRELPRDELIKFKDHLYSCNFCSQLVHDTRFAEMQAEESASKEVEIPVALVNEIKAQDRIKDPKTEYTLKNIVSEVFEKVREFFTFPKMVSTFAVACLAVFIIHNSLFDVKKSDFGMDLSIVGRIATGDEMRGESDYKEGILGPDSVLKSGDFFKINIKIDQSIYYYLILKDSQGVHNLLSQGSANPGDILTFPNQGPGYRLDNKKGVETIILIASDSIIKNFDSKMKKLKTMQPKELFSESVIKEFGFKHE